MAQFYLTSMAVALSPASHLRSASLLYKNPPVETRLSVFKDATLSSSASVSCTNIGVTPRGFCGNQLIVKRMRNKRFVGVRCATMEEIGAEKSMIEKETKDRMEKSIENLRSSFNSVRTGRSNPAILDKIKVEYHGTPVLLKSIAQISTPDASSLLVQPNDKSSSKIIEKAIVNSNLGLTPNNDGEVIRLALPPLTSDRRKQMLKVVAKQFEEGKVAIRNIRRDAIKSYDNLEKEKKLSEDNVKDLSSDLQKVADEYMKKIDSIYKQKEKEVMTV